MATHQSIVLPPDSRLTVLEVGRHRYETGQTVMSVFCRCQCGSEKWIPRKQVVRGKTRSCGCLPREVLVARNRTHGRRRARVYQVWANMIARCTNEKNSQWKDYGGRGIKVCEGWRTFDGFYAHVRTLLPLGCDDIPVGLFIDRIDNDGNYEPSNVRLVTRETNNRNRRNNVRVTMRGETRALVEWCQIFGISYPTVWDRHRRGMSYEEALTTPLSNGRFKPKPIRPKE